MLSSLLTAISLVLMGLGFWVNRDKSNNGAGGMLFMAAVIAWALLGFAMYNTTYTENTFMNSGLMYLSVAMVILNGIFALNSMLNARAQRNAGLFSKEDSDEKEFKSEVQRLTKKRSKHW